MLDLAFVRDHLPIVEEKMRQRGMDPGILKDFQSVDSERRAAITEAETMKARRNKLVEEFQRLKKEKQDTASNLQEQKDLKEKIVQADERVADVRCKVARSLNQHSQPAARKRAIRQERGRQRRDAALGNAAAVRLSPPSRIGSSANSSVSSTWSAPPRSPERALPSIGTWARSLSGR